MTVRVIQYTESFLSIDGEWQGMEIKKKEKMRILERINSNDEFIGILS